MNTKKILLIGGSLIGLLVVLTILRSMLTYFVGSTTQMTRLNDKTSGAYGFGSPSIGLDSFGNTASSRSEIAQSKPAADLIMPIAPPEEGTSNVPQSERKIIKTGTLSIVVKNVEETVEKISNDATNTGGYVSTTNFNTSTRNSSVTGYIRVRIPADKVNDFIRSTKGHAVKVTTENISSRDVTAEYIDLEARVKNLETSEAQYQQFMERATNVNEVLTIQRELTTIRGQIEQLKGQLQYLAGNAEMSDITINIALEESELPIQESDKWRPEYVFKMALAELTALGKNLSYLAIYLAVFAVVWVPVGVGMWFFYKFLRRKIK